MNERIKQLAEQAAISCGYFIGPRLYMTHEEEMEKFAELIVKECMSISSEAMTNDNWPPHMIAKHFGVKE